MNQQKIEQRDTLIVWQHEVLNHRDC
jgi:hypothetical protein